MREIRIAIATIVSFLVFMGIVMIYSSTGIYALQEMGDKLYFLKRHLIFLTLGLMLMMGVMMMDYRILQRLAKPLLLVAVILLVLVLIPGVGQYINGARRWFKLGPFNFQPSEFAKLAMVIYAADFLARKQIKVKSLREGLLPLLLVLGLVCALILKQPDLGSSFLIGVVVIIMLFIAGMDMKYLGFMGLMALPGFFFLVVNVPYRWTRIMTFLDPWQDSQGTGFQLTQSQIALGSGGLFGVGLGHSMQKLFYLPAAHTDFILSIIGEELGFVGAFTVIVFFMCFIWQGARLAKRVSDPFGYFLSIGIVVMLGFQAMINVGVSIGALPTKGLPLPFISYGGSALIFNLMAIGLLLNVSRGNDTA